MINKFFFGDYILLKTTIRSHVWLIKNHKGGPRKNWIIICIILFSIRRGLKWYTVAAATPKWPDLLTIKYCNILIITNTITSIVHA